MRKLINFCKIPLVVISSLIMSIGLLIIIVLACVPHGKTYIYSETIMGQYVEMNVTFLDDEELQIGLVTDGSKGDGSEKSLFNYQIEEGILYTADPKSTSFQVDMVGQINSYQIIIDASTLGLTQGSEEETSENLVLECKTNVTLKRVSIALIVLGGLMLTESITIIILSKYGVINQKNSRQRLEYSQQMDY